MSKVLPIFLKTILIKSKKKFQLICKRRLKAFTYDITFPVSRRVHNIFSSLFKTCERLSLQNNKMQKLYKVSNYLRRLRTAKLDNQSFEGFFKMSHSFKNLNRLSIEGTVKEKKEIARNIHRIKELKVLDSSSPNIPNIIKSCSYAIKMNLNAASLPLGSIQQLRSIQELSIDLNQLSQSEKSQEMFLKSFWINIPKAIFLKNLYLSSTITPRSNLFSRYLSLPSTLKNKLDLELSLAIKGLEKSKSNPNPVQSIVAILQKLQAKRIVLTSISYQQQISIAGVSYQEEISRNDSLYQLFLKSLGRPSQTINLTHLSYYSHINTLLTKFEIINILKSIHVKLDRLELNYSLDKYNQNMISAFEKIIQASKSIQTLVLSLDNTHLNVQKQMIKSLSSIRQGCPTSVLKINCESLENLKYSYQVGAALNRVSPLKELHLKIRKDLNSHNLKEIAKIIFENNFVNKVQQFHIDFECQQKELKSDPAFIASFYELSKTLIQSSVESCSLEFKIFMPTMNEEQIQALDITFLNIIMSKIFPTNLIINFHFAQA